MSKCEEICINCDESFYGYGESSMHYGLRCDRYEKCVDEKDSCDKFKPSSHILKKELESQLSQAKELIKEMQDALKFYATESNWRDIVAEEAINDRHGLSEGCFDSIIYEDCENDIGGKLARKTLKEKAEKIKALLGEE